MVCKKCGAEVENNKKFCGKCGTLTNNEPRVENPENANGQPQTGKFTNEKFPSMWPEWKIVELIGEGSYGKVYKAIKKEHSVEMFSAIKIIDIPKSLSELKSIRQNGNMTQEQTKTFLKGIVDGFVNEIKLMISLNSSPNIVNVQDYKVIEKTEEIGWEIHIRMELLESFSDYAERKTLSENEILKVGLDICSALESCAQKEPPIIHRDIKPDNIFYSKNGNVFKLGDFGIARELSKSGGASSQGMGTLNYMAPEVRNGTKYGVTADICSLGIVLYKLTNDNRLPFSPSVSEKQILGPSDSEEALSRRFSGEDIPAPVNAKGQVAQVILKACEFYPENRFQTATEFKTALQDAITGKYVDRTKRVRIPIPDDKPVIPPVRKKSKMPLAITAIILAVVLIFGGYYAITKLTDPIDALKKLINDDNYIEAANIIKDKIIDDDKRTDNAADILKDKARTIVDNYINESKNYDESLANLEKIKNLNVISETDMTEYFDNINTLQTSRTAYTTAQAYMNNNDHENAIVELRKVIEKDKNYSTAQQQLVNSIAAYKSDTFAKVGAYKNNHEYSDALTLLDEAQMVLPNDVDITTNITSCNKEADEFNRAEIKSKITEAKENAEQTKDYVVEINNLKLLQIQNPDNDDLKKSISDLENSHAEYIVLKAGELSIANSYNEAVTMLKNGLTSYAGNTILRTALTDTENKHANYIVAQASNLSDSDKFTEALDMLEEGQNIYPNNGTIKAAISDTETKDMNSIIAQADNLAKDKKYEEAIALLNKSKYSNSNEVKSKVKEYTNLMPVNMVDVVPAYQSYYYDEYSESKSGESFSMAGVSYRNGFTLNAGWSGWSLYNLNGEYSKLTAIICHVDGSGNSDTTLSIYFDGILHREIELKYDMLPQKLDLDINGVAQLKLVVKTVWSGKYGFGNPVLEK